MEYDSLFSIAVQVQSEHTADELARFNELLEGRTTLPLVTPDVAAPPLSQIQLLKFLERNVKRGKLFDHLFEIFYQGLPLRVDGDPMQTK